MNRFLQILGLGLVLILPHAVQGQDKPAEPGPAKPVAAEPAIDIVMETKIVEARAISDPENKLPRFPCLPYRSSRSNPAR